MKLSELAARLDCRLEGDGSLEIVRVAGIHRAEPGDLTFLTNARYLPELATTRASAVIVGAKTPAGKTSASLLRSDSLRTASLLTRDTFLAPRTAAHGARISQTSSSVLAS